MHTVQMGQNIIHMDNGDGRSLSRHSAMRGIGAVQPRRGTCEVQGIKRSRMGYIVEPNRDLFFRCNAMDVARPVRQLLFYRGETWF